MRLPLQDYLDSLHSSLLALREGSVATYIPELAKADPESFGICLVTIDGYVYAAGDANLPFTIQSISKPLVYAAALNARGRAAVLQRVGVEPSGDAFNSISLNPSTGAPLNPMINAGAIATTGLIEGSTAEEQWKNIVAAMEAFAGRPLAIDDAVYRSESETGFRNRAIGWMLRNFGILEQDPTPVLENYFRQCSVQVTCRDLGIIAATLANNGVHPITGKSVLPAEHVASVLGVMSTCGMYDYAGSWLYEIGMPAKSGVAGGILAVLPGRFGIGVFSPRVDDKGNSVRGIAACRRLSDDFGLHMFRNPRTPGMVLRREYSGADARSRRMRSPEAASLLGERGGHIRLLGLQGEIALAGAEYVGRRIASLCEEADSVILDMHRVSRIDASAAQVLQETRRQLGLRGLAMVYSRIRARPEIERPLKRALRPGDTGYLSFEDNDLALEWCENRLLAGVTPAARVDDLGSFPLFARLAAPDLERVRKLLASEHYRRGDNIIVSGQQTDYRIFLLLSGEVSVILPLSDATHQRVATLSAGMTFGEMALLGHTRRTATVHADTDAECWVLDAQAFDALAVDFPRLKIVLLENLSENLAWRLHQANQLIGTLAS